MYRIWQTGQTCVGVFSNAVSLTLVCEPVFLSSGIGKCSNDQCFTRPNVVLFRAYFLVVFSLLLFAMYPFFSGASFYGGVSCTTTFHDTFC